MHAKLKMLVQKKIHYSFLQPLKQPALEYAIATTNNSYD